MKRLFTVVAAVAAVALGVAGCSSDTEPAEDPVVEEASTAPEEVVEDETAGSDTDTEAGSIDACLALMEPLQEANAAMLAIAEDGANDPESTVAMWRALSQSFEDFGETASDPELAALSTAVGEDGHALTDVLETMYVDNDMSVVNEFTAANDAFFESYQELLESCGPTMP